MSADICVTLSCGAPAVETINPATRPERVCADCYEYFYTCPECGVEFDTDFMHTDPRNDISLVCGGCIDGLKPPDCARCGVERACAPDPHGDGPCVVCDACASELDGDP